MNIIISIILLNFFIVDNYKMNPFLIKIKTLKGEKGNLSILDKENNLPFDIKRIFYVYDIKKNIERGGHAHNKLKQFIWAINGVIEVKSISREGVKKSFLLDNPNIGLFIPELTWTSQHIKSDNTIYCVAASNYYDESEYLRNWEEFQNLIIGK